MIALRRFLVLIVTLAVLVPGVLALVVGRYMHEPRSLPGQVRVEVEPGDSPSEVASKLAEAGAAPWRLGNYWGLRVWGEPTRLKAGVYVFEGEVSPLAALNAIAEGRVDLVSITFPEGLTADQMGPLLEQAGITDAAGFVGLSYDPSSASRWGVPGPTLEGYLFPDTYRFARGLEPGEVITVLTDRFKAVAARLSPSLEAGEFDLRQWATLASIVEKETGSPEERPLVASVFLNRLRRGMRLESDPTVIYGIEDFDGNIRRKDLRRDTPYNTYTRKGIPPGPIANPGLKSLEAVLRPAESDFFYFVSRGDGTHVFTRTYDEHREQVRRYQLRGGR